MADQSMMQKIAAALTGGAGGLSGYANPGYAMYVKEARAEGRTPLPQAEWVKMQGQQEPAPQPQAPAAPAQPFRF